MNEGKQLHFDLDTGKIVEETTHEPAHPTKCKHNVKIKCFKQDYVSYCTKCGKFLSTKRRKILIKTKEGVKEI